MESNKKCDSLQQTPQYNYISTVIVQLKPAFSLLKISIKYKFYNISCIFKLNPLQILHYGPMSLFSTIQIHSLLLRLKHGFSVFEIQVITKNTTIDEFYENLLNCRQKNSTNNIFPIFKYMYLFSITATKLSADIQTVQII